MHLTLPQAQDLKDRLDQKYRPIADYVTFRIITPSDPGKNHGMGIHAHSNTLVDFIHEIGHDIQALAGREAEVDITIFLGADQKVMNDKTKTVNDLLEGKRKIFMHAVRKAQTTDVALPALPKIKTPRQP